MEKQADTLSDKVFDAILDSATFFFGMDITDIDELAERVEEDLAKKKELLVDREEREELELEKRDLPKIKEVTEVAGEIEVDEPVLQEGIIRRYTYKLHLPPMLAARLGDDAVDHSYPTLMYLRDLGYKTFDFIVNPAHKKEDICDYIAQLNPWDLSSVLSRALDHSETGAKNSPYPVAPIFYLTHVNSKGYFHVYPPTHAESIPDDAPGVMMNGTEEEILEDKKRLMLQLPPVDVTRLTFAPYMFEAVDLAPSIELRHEVLPEEYAGAKSVVELSPENVGAAVFDGRGKLADNNWIMNVQPIEINKILFIKQFPGVVQVLLEGFKGFLLETFKDIGKVYISELETTFFVPLKSLKKIELSPISNKEVRDGDYVIVDDYIGISLGKIKDELLVYIPDFQMYVGTDTWQPLGIS